MSDSRTPIRSGALSSVATAWAPSVIREIIRLRSVASTTLLFLRPDRFRWRVGGTCRISLTLLVVVCVVEATTQSCKHTRICLPRHSDPQQVRNGRVYVLTPRLLGWLVSVAI